MYNYNELNYFITIAKAKSFVGAAKSLGVSSSALSHSMRNLETRLSLRLFNRTTRSLSLTEAGEQLYKQIAPLYRQINEEVAALGITLILHRVPLELMHLILLLKILYTLN